MIELIQACDAVTAPLIRPYRPTSATPAFPPKLEDLVQSIVPRGYSTGIGNKATAPNQVNQTVFILSFTVDGTQQILMPLVSFTRDDPVNSQSSSVPDNLNSIKEKLSLSVTQMAELLNVTRKSVYDWYEGAEPRPSTIARINMLVEILHIASPELDLRRLKSIWKVPLKGQSFLAVLNDEKLDENNLRQALADKLHELSPRLAPPLSTSLRTSVVLGQAHLADIDRRADIS